MSWTVAGMARVLATYKHTPVVSLLLHEQIKTLELWLNELVSAMLAQIRVSGLFRSRVVTLIPAHHHRVTTSCLMSSVTANHPQTLTRNRTFRRPLHLHLSLPLYTASLK